MTKQHELDLMYLHTAFIWSERSKATRLQVGAVLVKDNNIIGYGYNGTPFGLDNSCEDSNNKTYRYVIHAEENALIKCARLGIATKGATIYVTACPCSHCAALLIQAGIERVVYANDYESKDGAELLEKAGILVQQIQ